MTMSSRRYLGGVTAVALTSLVFGPAALAGQSNGIGDSPEVSFALEQTFTAGTHPVATASGDFNHDGTADLAATNIDAGTVSVLLGNGDGTFASQQNFDAGDFPKSIVVGDFDRDGSPDIVVANFHADDPEDPDAGGTTISLLTGNGDGTFEPPVASDTGSRPVVGAADLNRDGRLDLAVANFDDDTMSILLGNGDGTFQDQQVIALGDKPTPDGAPAIADLNRDGKPDLAITAGALGEPGSVLVLIGHGDGTYELPHAVPAGNDPSVVTVGDFDRNGTPDLAVTNHESGKVKVLAGNGKDPLKFKHPKTFAAGDLPVAISVADLNGDGKSDLAISNFESEEVSVLAGKGKNTFAPRQTFTAGAGAFSVTVADFDRDGRPDLAVPRQLAAGEISVLLNTTPF